MRCERKRGSYCSRCYCLLFEQATVKRSAQCHVFAQSLSGRHSNDKYPVAPLLICVEMFHFQYYSVVTVIHIQCVRSQMCVCIYIHILHNIEMLIG